jgi:hypothetical protein
MSNLDKQLQEAIIVLEKLEQTPNRFAKEALLTKYRFNLTLKHIFKLALGDDRYHVNPSVNLVATSALSPTESWGRFTELVDKLKNQELKGTEAIRRTNEFLVLCKPVLLKWYCRILNRDLRVGVAQLTINNTWGDSLLNNTSKKSKFLGCTNPPPFLDVFTVNKLQFPLVVQPSIGGERVSIFCYPSVGEVQIYDRSGKRLKHLEQNRRLVTQVIQLCDRLNECHATSRPLFLEGKFVSSGDVGKYLKKSANPEEVLKHLGLVLYDWAPLDAYTKGSYQVAWSSRVVLLMSAAGALYPTHKLIRFSSSIAVLGHNRVFDEQQLYYDVNHRFDLGYSGVIIQYPNAPRNFTKAVGITEIRPDILRTGKIIDVQPGDYETLGVAPKKELALVQKLMKSVGTIRDTGTFIVCKTENVEELLRNVHNQLTSMRSKARFKIIGDEVGYRYAETLGKLVVETEDGTTQVSGGFCDNNKQSIRLSLWNSRNTLLGKKVEVLVLKDQHGKAVNNLARFKRLVP